MQGTNHQGRKLRGEYFRGHTGGGPGSSPAAASKLNLKGECTLEIWEVNYRLWKRARRSDRTIKVQAKNAIAAAEIVALRIWKYPFHIVSIF
jgi:hypothetical protein